MTRPLRWRTALALAAGVLGTVTLAASLIIGAPALAETTTPAPLEDVGVTEHLAEPLDLDLAFTDHTGESVTLGDYFQDGKPVLVTLNYYSCETLCGLQLNALLDGLKAFEWTAGEQFRIVTISIDPRETPAIAKGKRANYLAELGRGDDVDWSFLVGDKEEVNAITAQLGMSYRYDEETGQYAHPAALYFISPKGDIARYLYGLLYTPKDLKFSLMEAAAGRVGSPVDKILLSCFRYDDTTGQYTPAAFGVMRLGGVASMVAVGAFCLVMLRREKFRAPTGRNS